jgi:hypothetical protein
MIGAPSTVLVTGCSSGFGELTVKTLVKKGHRVFASMRAVHSRNAEPARRLREWAASRNLRLDIVEMDVTDEQSVQACVDGILAGVERLDVVVNNAGLGRDLDGAGEQRPPGELRPPQVPDPVGARGDGRAALPRRVDASPRGPGLASRACAARSRRISSTTNFVDRFSTLGLGADVPIATGSTSDSLLALKPDGTWVVLRVPYPLGFYARGLDGRIDDPNGGWKGRALYADYGENAVWHVEGGLGTRSKVVKFQIRPIRWRSRPAGLTNDQSGDSTPPTSGRSTDPRLLHDPTPSWNGYSSATCSTRS